MKKLFLLTFCLSVFSFAKAEHREHGAHVHGAATLGIAFDDIIGKIEFRSPADSIYGFEHKAKTEKQKQQQASGLKTLETRISEMVIFDIALSCVWKKEKIEVITEGRNHSDVQAIWSVTCAKSPVGSKIIFNVQKYLPKVQDLDVEALVGGVQASTEAKKNGTVLELK